MSSIHVEAVEDPAATAVRELAIRSFNRAGAFRFGPSREAVREAVARQADNQIDLAGAFIQSPLQLAAARAAQDESR